MTSLMQIIKAKHQPEAYKAEKAEQSNQLGYVQGFAEGYEQAKAEASAQFESEKAEMLATFETQLVQIMKGDFRGASPTPTPKPLSKSTYSITTKATADIDLRAKQ